MIARGTFHTVFIPLLIGIAVIALSIFVSSYLFYVLGGIIILISLFLLIFFRDPVRNIGKGVVAPADGKVIEVDQWARKISIFMGVHNVHVNRAPLAGVVLDFRHFAGKHAPAYSKESERNERLVTHMRTSLGLVRIVQVAGIFARRIVPYISPGQKLKKGQRIGIIRFGSRVDVYLPDTVKILKKEGDRVLAGTTQIGAVRYEMDK